ncbi:sensor histidine kinase [Paraburkholderia sp. UCT31]|uniref:sensor histidine kinase n=1 Tax=Paraburkholderia sp. UCT31 TaxID=2615209 RepID=UPI00292A5AC1|nr:ATP-binding protein [Paraburkholderia sp. UCT31]
MIKEATRSRVHQVTEIIGREPHSFGGARTKWGLLQGFPPARAKTLVGVLTMLIFGLDYYSPGDINPAIFYVCVIVALAWSRSARWLWGGTAVTAVLTVVGFAAGNTPVGHPNFDWIDWTNRCITISVLIVTAGFVHIGVGLSKKLEAREALLAEVAARERAEAALREVQADLAHAARVSTLGELTASIAHELKQPLAAISTNNEAGRHWIDRQVPNIAKALEASARITADARRCVDIIVRIREMAVRRVPEHKLVSLDELIDEALVFLRPEIQSRGVTVSHRFALGGLKVLADRIQLQQVIVNLLVNAMQAMEQAGSPERKITIRTTVRDASTLCCAIEDSGPGIAPEHVGRLFESFFTTKENGMGLGLPICRSILESHHGRIAADNASAHGGARFYFTIPAGTAIG